MKKRAVLIFMLALLSVLASVDVVCARMRITLLAENDWYPYSAEVASRPQGFSVDFITAAYKAVGVTVVYKVVPYARAMSQVKDGHYAGCFNAGEIESLKADYLLPKQSIMISDPVVWGTISAPHIKSYKDLERKTVGVVNGYNYDLQLTDNEKIVKDVGPTELSSMKKLALGRIDFTVIDRWVSLYLISRNKSDLQGKIRQVGVLQSIRIIPVFSKLHPDGAKARDLYDKGMAIIKKDGTYEKIRQSWEDKFR
ncbi:substrate-binding periplasmic protein [Geomonas edaphica]|uniref:substrate-binding periplasmic protein n=1 Tax=Geomonas edaphica TaxID=2570226 RepID=UPI0010A7CF55|nr:ABC transporter substrate-binding protein [Geomonas edaphica]